MKIREVNDEGPMNPLSPSPESKSMSMSVKVSAGKSVLT